MLLMMAAAKILSESVFSSTEEPLVIPSALEPLCSAPLVEDSLLTFNLDAIPDLYTCIPGVLQFNYAEKGVQYGHAEASEQTIKCNIPLGISPASFHLTLTRSPVYRSGINYSGVVQVAHTSGATFQLLLPGTRTYDPAGISGDPHCSERVGPSCSSALFKLVYAALVAASRGASKEGVDQLFNAFSSVNEKYHGRIILMEYMQQQVNSEVFLLKQPEEYPEFVKARFAEREIEMIGNREHTNDYFSSATKVSMLRPPRQYFRKVQAKDKNIADLLSPEEYQRFLKLV